jgi:hypothetical protein
MDSAVGTGQRYPVRYEVQMSSQTQGKAAAVPGHHHVPFPRKATKAMENQIKRVDEQGVGKERKERIELISGRGPRDLFCKDRDRQIDWPPSILRLFSSPTLATHHVANTINIVPAFYRPLSSSPAHPSSIGATHHVLSLSPAWATPWK